MFRINLKLLLLTTLFALFVSSCYGQTAALKPSGSAVVSDVNNAKVIDDYLTKIEKENNFSGSLLIVKDGKTIFKKGYGFADKENKIPFTGSTLASMGSITKTFTATAILKLAEENKLALNDSLKKFFPEIPKDKADITIHQLLTHSSGFSEFLVDDKGDYEKLTTDEFLKRAFAQKLSFDPGTKAVYTNVGMSILAVIIEKVSGVDYEEFLRKELFAPVGIKHLSYQYPTETSIQIANGYQNGKLWGTHQSHFKEAGGGPYWNLKGNGGLEVSLDEMEIWINAVSQNKILSKTMTEKMFTAHIAEDGTNGNSSFGYGCNITRSRRNTKVVDNGGSNGIYFARLVRLADEGIVAYMVTNESSINTNMVLPNVSQLLMNGKIDEQAMPKRKFESPKSGLIYDLLITKGANDFEQNLKKAGIEIDDDMILLAVGQTLTNEKKIGEAIVLYEYYTKTFPNIVVAQNDLGDLYLLKGEKAKAIPCYKRALEIRPENPRAKEALKKLGQ